jgi:hypothetical protein
MNRNLIVAMAGLALAGCVSFDGRGLAPGQTTENEVVAQMGPPADRIKLPDGDTMLYFPRQPTGRMMYAARIAPDGRLRSITQLLTEQNLANIVRGTSTRGDVRVILGPPYRVSRFERQQREVWQYNMINNLGDDSFLYVQMSDDGVVREVMLLKDYNKEPGGSKD